MIKRLARWILRDELAQASAERQQLILAVGIANQQAHIQRCINAGVQDGLAQAHDTIEALYAYAYPIMPKTLKKQWAAVLGLPVLSTPTTPPPQPKEKTNE